MRALHTKVVPKVRTTILFALLLCLILGLFITNFLVPKTFGSIEVRFADASQSGLSIVPASCPSRPHYAGQCGYCAIRAQDYFVTYGGSTKLFFSTSDDPQNATINQGVGSVASPSSANGLSVTNLTSSRAYTMTAGTYSCATAVITVCPAGQSASSAGCVSETCSGSSCPTGGGCPVGMHLGSSGCVADAAYCPDNSPAPNGNPAQCTCVHGNLSVCPVCPANTHMQDGACVVNTPEFVPFEATYSDPPAADQHFTATGHLQVIPQLIRQGETARLYWNVTHVDNCSITADHGTDHWAAASSGAEGVPSSVITQRTVYTLQCDAFTGATPPTIHETATVNVVPVFQEL